MPVRLFGGDAQIAVPPNPEAEVHRSLGYAESGGNECVKAVGILALQPADNAFACVWALVGTVARQSRLPLFSQLFCQFHRVAPALSTGWDELQGKPVPVG